MGLPASNVIAMILWGVLSTISIIDYIPYAKNLKGFNLAVFFLVFLIGGPIFGINQILTTLLDCILPEGWDDDDDFNQKY
jgi:hypothetical protein